MLLIEGFKRRTSGPATPFDSFKKEYEDIASLLGKEEPLPLPETSFVIEDILDDHLLIRLQQEGGAPLRINLYQDETVRLERGPLAVTIHFSIR